MNTEWIIIEGDERLTLEMVLSLYDANGWVKYTENPDQLMKAIGNSNYVISAWDDDRLVGLARSLSDDVAIHYLQDILVLPDYQHRGVGRRLLQKCLERYAHVRTHVLLTDDEERQRLFYESLGYKNSRDIKKFALNCFVKMKDITLE